MFHSPRFLKVRGGSAAPPPPDPDPDPTDTDPYFSAVACLLRGEGAEGGAVFTDDSTYAHAFTRVGTTIVTTQAVKRWGDASIRLDGTAGSYIETTAASAAFTFGNDPWDVQFSYKQDIAPSATARCVFDTRVGALQGYALYLGDGAVQDRFSLYNNGALIARFVDSPAFGAMDFIHIKRTGGRILAFQNGRIQFVANESRNITANKLRLGNSESGTQPADGWIDDFRMTKGVARDHFPVQLTSWPTS